MKLIITLLIFATLLYTINASNNGFNSFTIKGNAENCNLIIGTNNKCVSACGKSITITKKFMSSNDQVYTFQSYIDQDSCKKNALPTNTDFECGDKIVSIDDITIQCIVSSPEEIKARDTQSNNQINSQQSQQNQQNQQNNHEGNSSSTLIYSVTLIASSLFALLII
ncbi:hypothetical protein DICPUDRAFT_153080 [Dictyostelium purpureum]|uniref:Uncharacterized protein n=1 Tax=Dictyostelium purpureum TaxID=5786 RepID=F0ZN03_DICPU|nr:uncharacterized protein DICPUDRAFT_153080 [Dictyostelium purpureum]EGC34671.1 hypothetical protein DICPUDRAFT_153080 [Dictyostelium purpureum]|eukprot:XP_003288808.1 hypothetical protein DICPUDRAFT_153080 [Dictyostelium purpureum]